MRTIMAGHPPADPRRLPTMDVPTSEQVREVAIEALYREHARDVFRYALVLTSNRDEAEDITSSTFERALRAWSPGTVPSGPPLPWLLTIARRLATDRWRRAKRSVSQALMARVGETDPGYVETRLWLEALSTALPSRQREVLVLRYFRDLSDRDIGRLMDLTESGVRSLVARAINNLRSHPEVWK